MPSPKRLRHIAVILMHGVHHQLQGGINNRPGFFGIESFNQRRRAFEIGKQRGDRLALAVRRPPRFQRRLLRADALGQMWRRVTRWRLGVRDFEPETWDLEPVVVWPWILMQRRFRIRYKSDCPPDSRARIADRRRPASRHRRCKTLRPWDSHVDIEGTSLCSFPPAMHLAKKAELC